MSMTRKPKDVLSSRRALTVRFFTGFVQQPFLPRACTVCTLSSGTLSNPESIFQVLSLISLPGFQSSVSLVRSRTFHHRCCGWSSEAGRCRTSGDLLLSKASLVATTVGSGALAHSGGVSMAKPGEAASSKVSRGIGSIEQTCWLRCYGKINRSFCSNARAPQLSFSNRRLR